MWLYEGQTIQWIGGGYQARGHIVALAGNGAHVRWTTGPNAGQMTVDDIYDLEPYVAAKEPQEDPLHLTAVRNAFDAEGEAGVLNFLASNNYLDSWQKIAVDVLEFVQQRIRIDASMELVEEQLTPAEKARVVHTASLALLRDAFGIEE